MAKNILAAVAGLLALFVATFVLNTIAFLIVGIENSYVGETYNVSMLWIFVGLITGFLAAMTAGYVCKAIAKNDKSVRILLGIVVVLGLIMATGQIFMEPVETLRPENVSNMEAAMNSIQPLWAGFLMLGLWIVGVLYGAKMRKDGVGVTSVT